MGASTPPTAATMGRIAWRMFVSSPTVISYLISKPTSRKNTDMSTSLMIWESGIEAESSPNEMPTLVCQKCSKASAAGEFATMSATIAARSIAPAAFVDELVN